MTKYNAVKVIALLAAVCLLVFGQNCSKPFEIADSTGLSSNAKTGNTDEPAGPVVPLTDSERLGLKGRIAPEDYVFPTDFSVGGFPTKLSATKLFKNLTTLEAGAGLIPFEVNMPLWSDGAIKQRWYALPAGAEKIIFSKADNWIFPKGTVLVKQFNLRTSPTMIRRLETRVFVNENNGWKGYTYKWNQDQTDADLLDGAAPLTESITITDANGVTSMQTWSYPSRAQCIQCHSNGGFALGVRTHQLNNFVSYGSGSYMNQLQVLKDLKLISGDMPDSTTLDAFPRPDNSYISNESRALAYLSVNCGTCHYGTTAPFGVKLHFSYSLEDMNIINVAANNKLELGATAVRVKPGDKAASALFSRISRTDAARMPKIGSAVVDPTGISIVGQWIDSLQ